MSNFDIQPLTAPDKEEWRALFRGYADFYDVAMSEAQEEEVWGWLRSPNHVLEGLLARDINGRAIGFIHVRACPRTLGGCEIGFLDDIFVRPEARGTGAADALFAALKDLATERGWPALRWITQHFNERGRGFYDRYTSGPSDFIMYQWEPNTIQRSC
jgi:GNAT superfamily N-acetyltransferase